MQNIRQQSNTTPEKDTDALPYSKSLVKLQNMKLWQKQIK